MSNPTNAEGLPVRVKSPQRTQVTMHMHCLDDLVPADHPVRNVWQYVESLELNNFYRHLRAVEGVAGRDGVDPKILLALWLYATLEGVSSARRLAVLCERDFTYMWLCGEVGVNRDLLNTFRNQRPEVLDRLMTDTLGILMHHGLVDLSRTAQDGMRVRASAGKSSFRRRATLEKHLQAARERVAQMRSEEDDESRSRNPQEAARKRAAQERSDRVRQAIEEREKLHKQRESKRKGSGDEVRVSTTDPEARVMKTADGGFRPAYNVQFTTTAGPRLIVGVDVSNEGSDSGQMTPMIEQIDERFGALPDEHLTDGGFSSIEDTTNLERLGVKVYAPVKAEEQQLLAGKDPYARHRDDTDEYAAFRERMRTPDAKRIYRQRSSIAEFPNAGCRNRGLQQFRVRGLTKVKAVAFWHALVHNLQRIVYHGWLSVLGKR